MLDLYKEAIIDHSVNPRNKYKMIDYSYSGKAYNYICGDSFDLYLKLDNNIIKNISFCGSGCAISIASASIMTITFKGKSLIESKNIFKYFKNIMTKNISLDNNFYNINLLINIKKFPSRVKCATLIWNTFNDIIMDYIN